MLSHLSDRELLEYASLNRVLPLIIKARAGAISAEERDELRIGVKNLLDQLGVGGRLATYIASRKLGFILKLVGIADAVDTILQLMVRMSQIIVRTEFDSRILRGAITTPPSVFKGVDGGKVGFLCEALGRLWLKEVQGGVWSNARYEIIDTKDVDALEEEREGDRLNLYVAEIKRMLDQDDVKKLEGTIDMLRKVYAEGRKSIEKTVKSVHVKTLWVIDFGRSPKHGIEDELRKRLADKLVQDIRVTYLDGMKESCRKTERVGQTLLKSIELLESIDIIG